MDPSRETESRPIAPLFPMAAIRQESLTLPPSPEVHAELCFHAASSMDLPSILKTGLRSYEELVANKTPPFGGEISTVLHYERFPNWVSVTPLATLGDVLETYALGPQVLRGWSYEYYKSISAKFSQSVSDANGEKPLKLYQEIIEGQMKCWELLSEKERDFVSHAFPVIYAVYVNSKAPDTEIKRDLRHGGSFKEWAIFNPIPPEKIIVFVPQQKLADVAAYANSIASSSSIRSLGALAEWVRQEQQQVATLTSAEKARLSTYNSQLVESVARLQARQASHLGSIANLLDIADQTSPQALQAIVAKPGTQTVQELRAATVLLAHWIDERSGLEQQAAAAAFASIIKQYGQTSTSAQPLAHPLMLPALAREFLNPNSWARRTLLASAYETIAAALDRPVQARLAGMAWRVAEILSKLSNRR